MGLEQNGGSNLLHLLASKITSLCVFWTNISITFLSCVGDFVTAATNIFQTLNILTVKKFV